MSSHVKADNLYVGSILRKIVAIVIEGGAEFHPSLLIVEKDGEFALHSTMSLSQEGNDNCDTQLCRLPREMLLPTNGVEWKAYADQLQLITLPDHLSPIQEELFHLHVELYNATSKLKKSMKQHPLPLLLEHQDMFRAVLQVQPERKIDVSLANQFIKTHHCWLDDVSTLTDGTNQEINPDSGEWAIFPILDFLNNHHKGSTFKVDDSSVWIPISRPSNTSECFLRYGGRRDVLDYALGMGYLDQTTPFAHSAPFVTELKNLGVLRIEALSSSPKSSFDPPRVQFTDEGIQLSHFTCHRNKPKRSLLTFSLAIEGLSLRSGGSPSDAKELVSIATKALLQENLTRLENLQIAAKPFVCNWPSAQLLIDASRRQASIFMDVLSSNSCR